MRRGVHRSLGELRVEVEVEERPAFAPAALPQQPRELLNVDGVRREGEAGRVLRQAPRQENGDVRFAALDALPTCPGEATKGFRPTRPRNAWPYCAT